jgi:hypothetical protein
MIPHQEEFQDIIPAGDASRLIREHGFGVPGRGLVSVFDEVGIKPAKIISVSGGKQYTYYLRAEVETFIAGLKSRKYSLPPRRKARGMPPPIEPQPAPPPQSAQPTLDLEPRTESPRPSPLLARLEDGIRNMGQANLRLTEQEMLIDLLDARLDLIEEGLRRLNMDLYGRPEGKPDAS